VLRVLGDLLVLQTLRWPDKIRPTAGITAATGEVVHKTEIAMALQLAASMSEGYVLDDERDAYTVAMEELLAAKAGGGEIRHGAEPAAAAAPVVDLMAALQASLRTSGPTAGYRLRRAFLASAIARDLAARSDVAYRRQHSWQ
jgi:DNA end-binding protein Ku